MKSDLAAKPPTGERAVEQRTAMESSISAAEAQAAAPGALFALMETNFPLKREAGSAWKETGPLAGLIAFMWQAELQGKKQGEVKNLNGRPCVVVNIVPPQGPGSTPSISTLAQAVEAPAPAQSAPPTPN